MKINFDCSSREVRRFSELFCEVLFFEHDVKAVCITCEKDEISKVPTFSILKHENQVNITYSCLSAFARAMFILFCNEDKQNLLYSGKCEFKDFSVMVDTSRNAVPKIVTLKKMAMLLALSGYNGLGLYMEDTISIQNEPYFGYMRGSYQKREILELDSFCKEIGIELIPYIQTLAHLNQITRYQDYKDIIDTDDILLVGNEKTYDFLDKLLKTISEEFCSRKINIGMDEAMMLGLGKYLRENGYKDRSKIMLEHLKRVLALCKKYSFEPQMWSDMFFRLSYGSYLDDKNVSSINIDIPEEVKLMYWDYYSCDKSHYNKMISKHKAMSSNVGFAGGLWKWTGFTPHNEYSIEAGKASLSTCIENKIDSVVLTCWGDNGAESSIFSILPALFYDAGIAWDVDDKEKGFEILTGIKFNEFINIDGANKFSDNKKAQNNSSKYFLYNDVLFGTFDSLVFSDIENFYSQLADELHNIVDKTNFGYIFRTQEYLCRVLEFKALIGIELKKAYDDNDYEKLMEIAEKKIPRTIKKLTSFFDVFKKQWETENKSFGFEVQCIRLGGLQKRLEYVSAKIRDYCNKTINSIDELDEQHLPFAYNIGNDITRSLYNNWRNIVSPNVN